MGRTKGLRAGAIGRLAGAGVAAAALTVSLAVVSPASGATSSTAVSTSGGSVTFAEQAGSPPNYIFPFMTLAFFSVYNINQFQYLMYRPLYWFGKGATPTINPSLSLAKTPEFSSTGKILTITLKTYKWSNGEKLTSRDVMFWMNMLHAEKTHWAAYAPGGNNIPDNVTGITVVSTTQLKFHLTKTFNNYWYLYNQLSQITPMPVAWDISATGAAPGSGGCSAGAYGTVDTQCAAVYKYLSNQAGFNPTTPKAANNSLPTYATNPLWQVVDGPWHLTSFSPTGSLTMAPNKSYSGPVHPTIAQFKEVPFTSGPAEYNALVGGKVTYGYLPAEDITASTSTPTKAGANNPRLKTNFNLYPLNGWSINYFPYNFNSTGDGGWAGTIFHQLYFRQAMQYLIDQPAYISKLQHGYGVATNGPVPALNNSFASQTDKKGLYPYSPTKAKALLKGHGWKVVPNGTDTCQKPGTGDTDCGSFNGKTIPAGAKLSFTLQYITGKSLTTNTMNAEKSSWAQAGINISLTTASFNTVIGNATPCPTGCSWEMENWGAGWIFAPDYYPTGEELFQTGAGSNSGSFTTTQNDANITATNLTHAKLTTYENYLAKELPVVYQPNYTTPLVEINKKISDAAPVNSLQQINPENWRIKK